MLYLGVFTTDCIGSKNWYLQSVTLNMVELTEEKELSIVVYTLGSLYFLLMVVPVVQLVRIHLRVPDLGWTTQKLFLCLTLLSSLGKFTSFT
jgi:hypothetical protein